MKETFIKILLFLSVVSCIFWLLHTTGVTVKSDLEKERDSVKLVYEKWQMQKSIKDEIWLMKYQMGKEKRDSIYEELLNKIDSIEKYQHD